MSVLFVWVYVTTLDKMIECNLRRDINYEAHFSLSPYSNPLRRPFNNPD